MAPNRFQYETQLEVKREEAFAFHERPYAFERLCPPWEKMVVVSSDREATIEDGSRVNLKIPVGPFNIGWELEHCEYGRNIQFCDRQNRGPFKSWLHCHKFLDTMDGGCQIMDEIEYVFPLHGVSGHFLTRYLENKLEKTFEYRERVLRNDLALPKHSLRRVVLTGASGFLGGQCKVLLHTLGIEVVELSTDSGHEHYWDPMNGVLNAELLEGADAVIHLAGENIFGKWSLEKMKAIYESRVKGTELLVDTIGKLKKKPKAFLCASGINIYGTKRTERLHEKSTLGDGFLAKVCKDWEGAANGARKYGVRVVSMRTGVVLSPSGGMLGQVLPFFEACLGGRSGSGMQFMSWIAMDDFLYAVYHLLCDESIEGPVNMTSPSPCTNFQFKQALAKALKRPAWLPVPAWVLKRLLGELAEETVLADTKVYPHKLLGSGYGFKYPNLGKALGHLLGRG